MIQDLAIVTINVNRNSYAIYRMMLFSNTLNDHEPKLFQVYAIVQR